MTRVGPATATAVWLVAAACSSPTRQPADEETAAPAAAQEDAAAGRTAATPVADAAPSEREVASPVPAPDQPVVSFGGASRFGASSFMILPTGSARSSFTAPGKPAKVRTGMLAPRELAVLRDQLMKSGCCSLESQRTTGVPDEGHTNLNIGFPGLICSVSLWDNEWRELPAAAKCSRLLERIEKRLEPAPP